MRRITLIIALLTASAWAQSLSVSPTAQQTIVAGDVAAWAITASTYSGVVSYSATGLPANASVSFWPTSSPVVTTMIVSTNSNTATGGDTITVTGASGAQSATASPVVYVLAPGSTVPTFTLQFDQSLQTTPFGTAASIVYTVGGFPLNFTSAITLTVPATQFDATMGSSVGGTIPSGGRGSNTVTVTTTSATPRGTYWFVVQGTGTDSTTSAVVTKKIVGSLRVQ